MTLYIDIIFLSNIIMNYIILFATGLIVVKKVKHTRIILSSIIGAIYSIMLYITNLKIYENQIIKFILSIVMVYIAFIPKDTRKMIKDIIIFYLTSFCFGGAAYYLLYNVSPGQIKTINGILLGSYPLKIAILGGILGFFIINIAFKVVKNKIDKTSIIYDIEIVYQEKQVELKVLLDTGNLLVEPITKLPVVIVDSEKLKQILDLSSLEIMANANIEKIDLLEENLKLRCRVLPFSSVGKNNGIMIGFKPDYVKIYDDEGKIIKDVIIGVCNNRFNKNKYYSGLIGLDFLNREEGKLGDMNEFNSNVKI